MVSLLIKCRIFNPIEGIHKLLLILHWFLLFLSETFLDLGSVCYSSNVYLDLNNCFLIRLQSPELLCYDSVSCSGFTRMKVSVNMGIQIHP